MVKVAVITGNSASGLACMQKLLSNASTSPVSLVRGCFRVQGRAATARSSLPLSQLNRKDCKYDVFPFVNATDMDSLRRALEGIDRAMLVTPLDYHAGLQDDAAKSIHMIKAAQEVGVSRVVHVGSWTVQAPTELPILASRFVPTEDHLTSEIGNAMEWTVLRGGYFMSNFSHVHGASMLEKQQLLAVPDCWIPPVDVRDIGAAAAALLEADTKDYLLNNYNHSFIECCGPELLSHRDIAAQLSAGLNVAIEYPKAPSLGEWKSDNPVLSELYQYMAQGDGKQLPFDPKPFEKLLGRPLTTLKEWAAEHHHAFQYTNTR